MNGRIAVLMLSFSGLVLAGALIYVLRSPPPPPATGLAASGDSPESVGQGSRPILSEPTPNPEIRLGPAFLWSELESDEYRQYLINLVSVGCPEQIRIDIVLAEILRFYRPREAPWRERIAALQREEETTGSTVEAPLGRERYQLRKGLRAIELEKQEIVRELLGVILPLEPLRAWHPRSYERYESALAILPPEKRERARMVLEAYWEASDELNDRYGLQRPPEYLDAYQQLNRQRRDQLAQILTPTELEDYEMRTTGIASRLSQELAGVGITEEEFREIYAKRAALEAPFGGSVRVDMTEQGETPEHQQAREGLEREFEELLGPERFEAWKLNLNPEFQALADLGQRFGLPPENLREAFQVQQGNPRAGTLVRLDPLLSSSQPAQVPSSESHSTTRLWKIPSDAEATERLRELLTEEGFAAWQRRPRLAPIDWLLPP